MSEPQEDQPQPRPAYGPPPPGTPHSQPQQPAALPAQQPAQQPAPRAALSTGAIVGISLGGGLLLLILLATAAVAMSVFASGARNAPSPGADEPALGLAKQVVEEYLSSLAEGDADAALAHLWVEGDDRALLSDAVLAESLERAPLSDIQVGEARSLGYGDAVVPVTFLLGDEVVARTFQVWAGSGDPEIADGLVMAGLYQFEDLDVTVNGVAAEETAMLFPGVYEFALRDEHFVLEGDTTIRLAAPDDEYAISDLIPVLNEQATETFRSLVRASLEECLAMTTLATPCGLDVPAMTDDGRRVDEGTVRRELSPEGERALAALSAEQLYDSTTSAISWDSIDVRVMAALPGGASDVPAGPLGYPVVDFAEDELRVLWME